MATIRRLSDADVRAIFESLHGNLPPPTHLRFKIVPVGPNGQKWSPPPYEFEDGLYVLLKPEKKRKNSKASASTPLDRSKIPPHLKHHAMTEFPSDTCPWSLSGPQFPQPTAIQQRYCYPKGDPGFSCRKGGALWTMYGRDGKEDVEFRLLHVYFSVKRANNRGLSIPDAEVQRATAASNHTIGTPSPSGSHKRPKKKSRLSRHMDPRSPMSTTSGTTLPSSRSSMCSSPLSFDMAALAPPSPCDEINRRSIFVSPHTTTSPSDAAMGDFHPVLSFEEHHGPKPSTFHGEEQIPKRVGRSNLGHVLFHDADEDRDDDVPPHYYSHHQHQDPFPVDMDEFHTDVDSYWSDPLFAISLKPSVDGGAGNAGMDPQMLRQKLEVIHERIREGIMNSPQKEQGACVNIFATWARKVAKSPLSNVAASEDASPDATTVSKMERV